METSRASSETYEMERPDVDLRSLDEALERAVIGPLGVFSRIRLWYWPGSATNCRLELFVRVFG